VNGDTLICRILKAEGVEWLGAFPHQSLIDIASREGIRPIICRQERAGVNMADGFSRINSGRKIGVFTMQYGPGAENAFAGVAQAFADSVPLLLLPGGVPRHRMSVPPNFEAVPHYRGVTKWAGHINFSDRISEMMRRAFSQLRMGKPGPVLVEIPADVAAEEVPDEATAYQPVKPFRSAGDPDAVREMVTAFLKAKTPVICAGQGVLYAQASDELLQLADLVNAPVMTTLAGKSAFPETHRLSIGTGGHSGTLMVSYFLKKSDFVLGIGTSFTVSTFNAPMPKGVPLAQVTVSAEDINKDYRASYGAVGDAKVVLKQIIEEVKRQAGQKGRADTTGVADEIAKVRAEWMREWEPRFVTDEVPINPYRVFRELEKSVNVADTIVTHDSGYPRDQLVPFWKPVKPNGYIGWGKSTQLGYGLGLALGAKMAAPEKTVINFMGDAAFGMSGLDIETAARNKIGTLTIVLNNGVMTGYAKKYMPHAADAYGSNQLGGNYAKVSEALGAYAERIEAPDKVAAAIKRGIAATKKGQPAVIEVMTKEEMNVSKHW